MVLEHHHLNDLIFTNFHPQAIVQNIHHLQELKNTQLRHIKTYVEEKLKPIVPYYPVTTTNTILNVTAVAEV